MPAKPYPAGPVLSAGEPVPYSGVTGSARMSYDRYFRYSLDRRWGERGASGDGALWVMLNPSTADGLEDDQTIRRCITFSRREGFSSLTVVNLFALRATDPKDLLQPLRDAVGPENDTAIIEKAKEAQTIIVAWGSWGARFPRRAAHVLDLLRSNAFYTSRLYCLGTTARRQPRHPSRLANDTKLEVYRG